MGNLSSSHGVLRPKATSGGTPSTLKALESFNLCNFNSLTLLLVVVPSSLLMSSFGNLVWAMDGPCVIDSQWQIAG